MAKNLYITIQLFDFEAFLGERGFSKRLRTGHSKEWQYVKFIRGTNYGIVIYSSIEVEGRHQRGYGEDAIRCQLQHANDKRPLMDLSATKRVKNWRTTLGTKIDLLEKLCQTIEPCPKCGSDMRPIHGNFGRSVIWVCFNRKDPLAPCKGVRYITSELADSVADYWPQS
jgi:hypothetical protein